MQLDRRAQKRFDYVLANPPFGKKSSMTITNDKGEENREALTYERQDFWATTSQQAAQLRAAHRQHAEGGRQGGRGAAGQRAL
jgi:type I restriction-modification system DNA methylase subunit